MPQDVTHYIKCYLDTKNRTLEQFKDTLPGTEYVLPSEMSQGLYASVKCARAALDEKGTP